MFKSYKNLIEEIVRKECNIEISAEIILSDYGDITLKLFNVAKKVGKDPSTLSKELEKMLKDLDLPEFSSIESIGPYLNFFVSTSHLAKKLYEIYDKEFPKRSERVLIEHTSANPTGPIHIGRARNPIIGDSIARLFRVLGYTTIVEYYVNDLGKQVSMLLATLDNNSDVKSAETYTKLYQEAYKEEEKYNKRAAEIMNALERCDEKIKDFSRKHIKVILDDIINSLKKINVEYDSIVYESDILCRYGVDRALEILKDRLETDDTGAKYIKIGEEKIYVTRKDGTTLYFLRDILYHLDKMSRCDRMINVLGEDHRDYGRVLQTLMKELFDKAPEIIYYSFVSLPEGKMSTRAGRVVYLKDVVSEAIRRCYEEVEKRYPNESLEWKEYISEKIGISSVRFNILKIQNSKPVIFRWDEALNFEGESAPYIIYSYARACSILRKIENFSVTPPTGLKNASEILLLKKLATFYDLIEDVSKNLEIHLVARYAIDLADTFNAFYRDCPVITSDEEIRNERATLVKIFKEIMGKTMYVLGIEKLEKI